MLCDYVGLIPGLNTIENNPRLFMSDSVTSVFTLHNDHSIPIYMYQHIVETERIYSKKDVLSYH